MEDNIPIIIVSGKPIKDYLSIIFKLGKYSGNNRIIIQYMDKYADKVDALLYGLRKSFGWLQVGEMKKVECENKKCVHFNNSIINQPGESIMKGPDYGKCMNKDSTYRQCTFQILNICKHYQQKDNSKFLTNEVIIEKHGALRGL